MEGEREVSTWSWKLVTQDGSTEAPSPGLLWPEPDRAMPYRRRLQMSRDVQPSQQYGADDGRREPQMCDYDRAHSMYDMRGEGDTYAA